VHLGFRGQAPERTWVEVVSPNYFALAGATPAVGQLLRPGEGEQKGAAPTPSCSRTRTGSGASPATRRSSASPIALNGRSFTVVGVAAESFTGLSWAMAVSAWVPAGDGRGDGERRPDARQPRARRCSG
jgi:hypothetical protein